MRQLLRSVIDFDGKLAPEDLRRNFLALKNSGLGFDDDVDEEIFSFVDQFFSRSTDLPSPGSLRSTFQREKKLEAMDRLEILAGQTVLKPSDFEHRIQEKFEEDRKSKLQSIMAQAKAIAHEGVQEGKGKNQRLRQGVDEALKYIYENADLLNRRHTGIKLSGDITDDAAEILAEYAAVKADPTVGWGRIMRLNHVDEVCKGVKKGELWIHAAFTGELKTTLALNWAYNTAIYSGWNVMYFTLEMSYEQIRRILFILHSTNGKFRYMCMVCRHVHPHLSEVLGPDGVPLRRNPPQVCSMCGGPVGHRPLEYAKVRDGELTDDEEAFMQLVADDMVDERNNYGHIFVERPVGNTTVPEMRVKAEVKHQQTPLHLIFIDHLQIAASTRWVSSRTDRDNSIVLDAKRMALDFNNGESIPVVGLFQINRQGKSQADKLRGKYEMSAISYANEAERSADVISYTYLNEELRELNESLMGCLKNRDNALFPLTSVGIDWVTRRVGNLTSPRYVIDRDGRPQLDDASLEDLGV